MTAAARQLGDDVLVRRAARGIALQVAGLVGLALLLLVALAAIMAQTKPAGQTKETEAEFIKAAEEGAPARISAQAAVARIEPKGQVTMVRPGSNGFTCTLFPDESHAPFCGDKSAFAGSSRRCRSSRSRPQPAG